MSFTSTAFRGAPTTTSSAPYAVTSKTTNYEIWGDDTSGYSLSQPTISSEPYFDAQTPRNVTGLVGKHGIDMRDKFPIFASWCAAFIPQICPGESFADKRVKNFYFSNFPCHAGKSAYLSCRVRSLGNKTVSWIRHRDIHILTVGSYTYTSDQRFQVGKISAINWLIAFLGNYLRKFHANNWYMQLMKNYEEFGKKIYPIQKFRRKKSPKSFFWQKKILETVSLFYQLKRYFSPCRTF